MSTLVETSLRSPGGKAAVLQELQAAGFCVPEFVVSPDDLLAAVRRLGFPLAVRSSASVEDGPRCSFAGQFSSYLGLTSLEEVEEAVHRCRQSVSLPGVIEYCCRNGIDPAALHMDVIVQRLIEPELAGVAFTVNPMTGAEEVVIEACAGLADGLLAGRIPPLRGDHPLLKRHAPIIAATAGQIMRHFGAPQDVEFAIASGVLHVLQARPITRIGFEPGIGEWTNADFRDGGVSSRVCSPLMWSLYDFIWENTLKDSLRRLRLLDGDFQAGRMFFGRPYWNLGAVKRCVSRLPGFVEREFDADLSVQPTYDGDGLRTPVTLGGVLRALPTVLAVRSFLLRQESEAHALLARGIDTAEERCDPLPVNVEASFRDLVLKDYFTVESCYFRTIFAASLAKLDFKMTFPDADYAALVAGLPPLRHMDPVRALHALAARGDRDVTPLLRQFRHHSRLGLDVLAPRWDEDRAFVEELLDRSAPPTAADPRPAFEQAQAEALRQLSAWQRPRFRRKLARLRTLVWLREELRDLSSRVYYHIRRHVLEIARHRRLGEHVFFMTFAEIFADDRTRIAARREVYESYRNFAAPREIGCRYPFAAEMPPAGALRGIGASPGVARGVARRARSVREALSIEPGAILVCPFTDPGWTPVLDRVAGVVTETGGLLSHAAIICREYGIPAVLAVPGATERLREGQTLIIDGGQGTITLAD